MEETKVSSNEKNQIYYCQKCKSIPKLAFKGGPDCKIEVFCENCKDPAKTYDIKEFLKETQSLPPYEPKAHYCTEEGCNKVAVCCLERDLKYLCEDCRSEKYLGRWQIRTPSLETKFRGIADSEKNIKEGIENLHKYINNLEIFIANYDSYFQTLKENLKVLKEFTEKTEETCAPILEFLDKSKEYIEICRKNTFDYRCIQNIYELNDSVRYFEKGTFNESLIIFLNGIKRKTMTPPEMDEIKKKSATIGKAYPYLCKKCWTLLEEPLNYLEGEYGDYQRYDGDDHYFPKTCDKCGSATATLHY